MYQVDHIYNDNEGSYHITTIAQYFFSLFHLIPSYTLGRVGDGLRIKVGDFGLTRDVYSNDYYRANKNAKLPVKWMSPEALHDNISNEKTDVVSSTFH